MNMDLNPSDPNYRNILRMQAQLAERQVKLSQLETSNSNLRADCANLKKCNQILTTKKSDLESRVVDFDKNCNDLNELRERLDQKIKRNNAIESEIKRLQSECRRVNELLIDNQRRLDHISELETRAVESQQTREQEQRDWNEKLKRICEEKNVVDSQVKKAQLEMTTELDKVQDDYESKLNDLNRQVRVLSIGNEELERRLASCQEEYDRKQQALKAEYELKDGNI